MQSSNRGTIDLSPEDLARIKDILGGYLNEHEVYVFGSRASGKGTPNSDLDLLIKGRKPLDLTTRANLLYDLQESKIYPRVDLVDWWATDEAFRSAIEPDCKLIYSADSKAPARRKIGS